MASKDRPPRPEDNGWLRGGEMDYDQMLAHYQVQEPEEPHEEPKERKTFISSLISDVKSEGKFSKKKGSRPAHAREALPEEAEPPAPAGEEPAAPEGKPAQVAPGGEEPTAPAPPPGEEEAPPPKRQPTQPPRAEEAPEPSWQAAMEAYLSRARRGEAREASAPQEQEPEQAPPVDLEELKPGPRLSAGPEKWDRILEEWPGESPREPEEEQPPAQAPQPEKSSSGEQISSPGRKKKAKRPKTEKKESLPLPVEPEEQPPAQPHEAAESRWPEKAGGGLLSRFQGLLNSTRAPAGEPEEDEEEPQPAPGEEEKGEEPAAAAERAEPVPEAREEAAPPSERPPRKKNPPKKKAPRQKKAGKEKEKSRPAPREKEEPSRRSPTVLEWVYIETYYIGIQLMRDVHLMRRGAARRIAWLARVVPAWLMEQRRRFLRFCDRISDKTLSPYREIARRTGQLRHSLKSVGRKKGSARVRGEIWKEYFSALSRPLNHIANFVAPIVGVTILAATVNYFTGLNYALSVEYSGHNLGYIARESVFYDAQQSVLDRMINEEYLAPENAGQPTFRIVIADEEDLIDQETLANRIITISQNEVQEADGVYIEGAFLGALEDGNEFLMYIDNVLETYRTGIEHELVQFVKSITVRRGIYPKSSVVSLHEITDDMESEETRTVEYTVEEGDTLSQIAEENNTTVEELLLLNPELEERTPIPPEEESPAEEEGGASDEQAGDDQASDGQTGDDEASDGEAGEDETAGEGEIPLEEGEVLTVARVNLSLGVQVTRRETYTEEIPYGTTTVEDNRYYKGYEVTISAGIPGEQEVTADVTYIDGEKVGETRIGTPVVLSEPVNAQVLVGTLPILTYLPSGGNSSDSFMWPVKGGYVTAGLYGYAGHTGMDIAALAGTEIRAAKDGQVTYATNYSIWPYGKQVRMSHGDGVTTLYAHCSAVFVTAGQYVRQGDLIALVGRTGNATGNHLHFEIKINGVIMNPANFIGTYWPGY